MHLVLGWRLFTGSTIMLAGVTLALTVPLAWLLRATTARHRPATVSEIR
jgi:hypothetical protein